MGSVGDIVESIKKKMRPPDQAIRLTEAGFGVGGTTVAWASIEKISVFKVDAVTVDDVYFEIAASGQIVHICEEQPGFDVLVTALENHFLGVAGWRERVMLPAFAENYTVLYGPS